MCVSLRLLMFHCCDSLTRFISFLCLSLESPGSRVRWFCAVLLVRMGEALNLFKDVVNSPYFIQKSIILFLNKKDLFQVKLETVRQ